MLLSYKNGAFYFMLVSSTIIIMNCSSWIMMWMMFEMNLMVLVPIIILNDFNAKTFCIKYFIIQMIASSLMIFSLVSPPYYIITLNMSLSSILIISMSVKMGFAPFHYWMLSIAPYLKPMMLWLILSWQKVAPIMIMTYLNATWLIVLFNLTAWIGSLGGLNTNSIMILMFYSSMVHLGWMGLASLTSEKLLMIYLMGYLFINWAILFFLMNLKKNKKSSISSLHPQNKITFMLLIMSLGGLPPFLGFSLKLISTLIVISTLKMFLSLLILMLCSLMSLSYYLSLCNKIILMVNLFSNSFNSFNYSIMSSYFTIMAPVIMWMMF